MAKIVTWEIGRDSDTGLFIPKREAQKRKATATVETMQRVVGKGKAKK